MRKTFIFITLMMVIFGSTAQNATEKKKKPKKFSALYMASFEMGSMLGNSTDIGKQLSESVFYDGLDFRLGFNKNDQKEIYNQLYRLPSIGLGVYGSNFHDSQIGKPNAVYFYFNMPIRFEGTRKWTMSYSGAFGLSYNFNPYDKVDNPANVFLGSANNCYVDFRLKLNYHISQKWVADLAFGFKHFSNGGFRLPNSGVNLIPLSLGVTYKPNGFIPFEGEAQIPEFMKHNQFNIAFVAGTKNYVAGESNHLKAALEINWLRAFSYKYRGGLGLDIFYAAHAGERLGESSTFGNSVSFAAVASWEWAITKRLYVPVGLGLYLKRNETNGEREIYYERAGLRYRFDNNLFAGITIKAHGGTADFFEWTVGYTLKHDPNKY